MIPSFGFPDSELKLDARLDGGVDNADEDAELSAGGGFAVLNDSCPRLEIGSGNGAGSVMGPSVHFHSRLLRFRECGVREVEADEVSVLSFPADGFENRGDRIDTSAGPSRVLSCLFRFSGDVNERALESESEELL